MKPIDTHVLKILDASLAQLYMLVEFFGERRRPLAWSLDQTEAKILNIISTMKNGHYRAEKMPVIN